MNHATVKYIYNDGIADGTLLTKEDAPMIQTLIKATVDERSKHYLARIQPCLLMKSSYADEFLSGILDLLENRGDVFINRNGGYTPVPNHLEIITIKDKIN